MRIKSRHLLWGTIGIILLIALFYAFRPSAVDVDIAPVKRGHLLVTINQEGKTRIRERYVVSSPLSGQLLRIRLHAGDPIQAEKTVLAAIEPSDPGLLDARVKSEIEARVKACDSARLQAETVLSKAKQAHQYAVAQFERIRTNRQAGIVSAEEYDAAENRERTAAEDVRTAQYAVRVATFEYELAKAAMIRIQPRSALPAPEDRFEIYSPITGKVLRVFQESSAVITTGTKLLEVGDPTDLEMEIDVLSTDAVKIRPGSRVIIEHWGGPEPLNGFVRIVEPSAFLKVSALGVEEQRVNVIADFTDPPAKRPSLGDGYRIEARIVIWENETLKVPAGALFRRGEDWMAFAVRDGRAQILNVKVGHSNGLETEVIEGLSETDQVILHPSDRVRNGVRVERRITR